MPKKPRAASRKARVPTEEERITIEMQREANRQKKIEDGLRDEEEKRTARLDAILKIANEHDMSLFDIFEDFLVTKDRAKSSQVSRMLLNRGDRLLELIKKRQPAIFEHNVILGIRQRIAAETASLADAFRLIQGASVIGTVSDFSLATIPKKASTIAPTLCDFLSNAAGIPNDLNGLHAGSTATTQVPVR